MHEEAVILFILPHRVMPIEVTKPHIALDSVTWVLIPVFSFSFLKVFLEFHQCLQIGAIVIDIVYAYLALLPNILIATTLGDSKSICIQEFVDSHTCTRMIALGVFSFGSFLFQPVGVTRCHTGPEANRSSHSQSSIILVEWIFFYKKK